MKDSTTIKWNGLEIDVEFLYYAPVSGTYEDPPEPEMVEVEKVTCQGADITPLVESLDLWEEIEELIIEKI
jgi:hypothetical protein